MIVFGPAKCVDARPGPRPKTRLYSCTISLEISSENSWCVVGDCWLSVMRRVPVELIGAHAHIADSVPLRKRRNRRRSSANTGNEPLPHVEIAAASRARQRALI